MAQQRCVQNDQRCDLLASHVKRLEMIGTYGAEEYLGPVGGEDDPFNSVL